MKHDDGQTVGIEAVIDKDRSGFKRAQEVDTDVFMILTDVDAALKGELGTRIVNNEL
ncbi:hypothetical protein [Peribacillus aracenensis]|uniref:hypothetical protein n=1 Tax=Peribacillus aracenensis TaxID=2976708 RepID=UPI0021A37C72|nr:hypothetical protein [Peribacillus sp. BBB004]